MSISDILNEFSLNMILCRLSNSWGGLWLWANNKCHIYTLEYILVYIRNISNIAQYIPKQKNVFAENTTVGNIEI